MNKLSSAEVLIKAFVFRLASGENSQYRSKRCRNSAPGIGTIGGWSVLICCFSV